MWWGWPFINGKVRRDRLRTVIVDEILAVRMKEGFQAILPGLLTDCVPDILKNNTPE